MVTAVEQKIVTEKKVKMVTLRNVGHIYRSDDMAVNVSSVLVKPSEEYAFSFGKAVQILRDFPNNWEFVSADPATTEELQAILKKSVDALKKATANKDISFKKPQQVKPIVSNQSQIDAIVAGIRKADIEAREVKSEELYHIISQKGYTPAGDYSNKIELFPGEIGSNIHAKTRYIVTEFKQKKKNQEDSDATKEAVTNIKPSVERDPEEMGAAEVFDDLDKDLDSEDKHRKANKRPARIVKSNDDDDDED